MRRLGITINIMALSNAKVLIRTYEPHYTSVTVISLKVFPPLSALLSSPLMQLLQPLCAHLFDHLSYLLYSYWTLATAAAAFTLTPGDSCSNFRCCDVCVPEHRHRRAHCPQMISHVAAVQKRSKTLSSPRQIMQYP